MPSTRTGKKKAAVLTSRGLGAGVAAVRAACPWTPGAESVATAPGRLGEDSAVMCELNSCELGVFRF